VKHTLFFVLHATYATWMISANVYSLEINETQRDYTLNNLGITIYLKYKIMSLQFV